MKKIKRKRLTPNGWKSIRIGDVFITSSGATPLSTNKAFYENGTIPWINSGELSSYEITSTKNYITAEGYASASTQLLPEETVLVAMYGATAGKTSILKMEACTNQAICAIHPHKDYDSQFVKYSLDFLYDYLVSLSSGSARDNLSQADIANLTINAPVNKQKQRQLVKSLSLIDKKIALNRSINHNLASLARSSAEAEARLAA